MKYTTDPLPEPRIISKIYKRDGRLVDFDRSKIEVAIGKAFKAAGQEDPEKARLLTFFVISVLESKFGSHPPTVEQVQDVIEKVLISNNYPEAAKAYILYRQQRAQLRDTKRLFVTKDELKLNLNAIQVLESRYLEKDADGKIIETPMQMFRRVASFVAKADAKYKSSKSRVKETEGKFYKMMSNLDFLPNSPTLMNADTRIGQLAACFVLPVGDSMKDIFNSLRDMALIHQSGGGTGFSFSFLRPEGDMVGSTKGIASGPLSFMKI
ncbi:MAG: hypothetical protein KJ574_03225 [Nanoarchaeota archaeon]|nr:hypothetical protein [Nanoarchaeota archaeon]